MVRLLVVLASGCLASVACSSVAGDEASTTGNPSDASPTVALTSSDGTTDEMTADRATGPDPTLAVQVFLSRLASSRLFDEQRAFALIVLEPSTPPEDVERFLVVDRIGAIELEGYSFWPQAEAFDDFARLLSDRPDLVATADRRDMPFGFALTAAHPVGDVEQLEAELLPVPGVDRVIPLELGEPGPTVIPPGWEEVADVGSDLSSIEHQAVVGGQLVAWTPAATIVVDGEGAVVESEVGPLSPGTVCCGSHRLVSTGSELVVLGAELGNEAALFDPVAADWRRLPDRPVDGPLLDAGWDGSRVLVVVAAGRSSSDRSHALALDPVTGVWTALDDPPVPVNTGGLVIGNDRVVLSGTHQGPNNNICGGRQPIVVELRNDRWRALASPPIDGQASITAPLAGGLVSWNYQLDSAVFDGQEWVVGLDLPGRRGECYPQATTIADRILSHSCLGLAAFDATERRWTAVPIGVDDGRGWRVVASSEAVLAIGRNADGSSTVYRLSLAALTTSGSG